MKQINKTCIRLLSLMMLFLFTGIGNVWADDLVELYSADFDQTGDTHAGNSNSYSDHTYSASGVNWTIAYSEICSPSAAISGYSCIGRVAKKTTNSPTMTTGAISVAGNTVKKISFDVKGATTITVKCYTSTTGANNDWSELYSGSATSTKSTVTKENLTIACPIYLKFVGSVSSSSSNNARDFAIDNVKVEGISASATLSATPATIDFGTVEQGATVEAKAVAVSFANLTSASVSAAISNSAELATPAFSVSPASLTESGNVTITPSTATVGNYTETLTLTAADGSKTATVTVKMNVEAPFNGKKVAFSFTSAVSGWKTSKNDAAVGNYTYTIGEEPNQETYTFYQTKESDGIYCSSGYLMINSGNALGLPAVEGHKLVKVVATNSNTCSNATKIAIKDGTGENATAVGAEQTWSTTNSTYTYDLTGTAVNTMYYLCVSNKNCQLTGLTLFYEAVALNEITVKTAPTKVEYTAGESFAPAGLVITATYTDGTQKDVAYADAASDFSFAPSLTTALTTENDKVVITYGGKSVNQTITVNEATGYTVMIDEDIENGSVTAEPMTNLAEGDEVTLTATPAAHYSFGEWAVTYNDGEEKTIDVTDNQFTMPAYDVNVTATFVEDAKYNVTYVAGATDATGEAPTENTQYAGVQVTLEANTFAREGYKFTGWAATYIDTDEQTQTLTIADNKITMPAANVTLTAQWEKLSVWATTYTSNVTMSSDENKSVKIEETTYSAVKTNKGSKATVTIPANTEKLHIHIAAWNGERHTATLKYGDVTENITIVDDNDISGPKATYELTAASAPTKYYFSFDMADITEETTVTITAASNKRFVLFGVNAEVTTLDVVADEEINAPASYGNVIIEAGKALTVNAALTVTGNLVLQAKDDNKPEVVLNGDVTATNMYYEWTVATNSNNVFALPCNVAWADIEYWNGTAWDDNFNLFITTYNGQSRAEYGVADEEHHNWRYLPATEALQANVGYILYVPAGQVNNLTEVTLRFKLSDAALSRAPRTYSTTAYTATNGEGNAADAGWNYVGNPLLQSYASSVGDVKYATIPNLAGTAYTQGPVTSNVLKPFTPFFVQVEGAKTLTFSLNAPAAMPALYRVENEQAELFAEVTLDNERTGLWMADKYTTAYEINADLVKMFGENTTTVYTVSGNTRLAYNALPDAAAEAIPVGFSALAGEHTFSLAEGYSDGFEQLNLIDHVAGAVIDLLSTDYTFTLTENESMNETRFELNAVRADAAGQTTGIEAVGHELLNEGVYKLLIDGKVYIIRNGVWYDVTGRMVK